VLVGYEVTPYTLLYLGAALVSMGAAVVVWRRRSAPGGLWLFLMLVAMIDWTVADALDVSAPTLAGHIFWGQVSYLGSSTVVVFLLLFALEYTDRSKWVTPRTIAALFVVPVLSIIAVFTNGWHGLVWSGYSPVPGSNIIIYHHAVLYWVKAAYIYGIALVAAVLLVEFAVRTRQTYRYQGIAILTAVVIPLVGEAVYDFTGVLPGLDVASITLTVSGAILAFTLWRLKLLDLVPVARETLVDGMADGILALDLKGRIVDINAAAAELVRAPDARGIGLQVDEVTAGWPGLAEKLQGCGRGRREYLMVSPSGRHVSVNVSELADAQGRCTGTLTVMRDITGHVDTEEALQTANRQLEERIHEIEGLQAELREQAIRDPLTGLYNRRYLSETLERELARAMREGYPVSLVMADIDHFKMVNDSFGHAAGDLVLRSLGSILRADTRPGDIACRYGGEEFLLVLPNTDARTACQRAEQLRAQVASTRVAWLGREVAVTLSLGVASFPLYGATGDEVIAEADLALYAAKAAGRDRVWLAGSDEDLGPTVTRLA
jgi:diguanylate cyclase (GGDEF)-like protein/PAS domain S-box-containing protein